MPGNILGSFPETWGSEIALVGHVDSRDNGAWVDGLADMPDASYCANPPLMALSLLFERPKAFMDGPASEADGVIPLPTPCPPLEAVSFNGS